MTEPPFDCPVCRRNCGQGTEGTRARVESVGACGHGLVVDDILCLPPDLAAFRSGQFWFLSDEFGRLLDERAVMSELWKAFVNVHPAASEFTERLLPGIYAHTQHLSRINRKTQKTLLDSLCSARGNASTGWALEVGCATGGFLSSLRRELPCVGMDARVSLLRVGVRLLKGQSVTVPFRVEGSRFVPLPVTGRSPKGYPVHLCMGTVEEPPFAPESFDVVVAMSLLDTVRDPVLALGQMDALLRPGGWLLLAQPWQWEPRVTPPEAWLGGGDESSADCLVRALQGEADDLPHLRYDIVDRKADLPWDVPGGRQVMHRYRLSSVLARKKHDHPSGLKCC